MTKRYRPGNILRHILDMVDRGEVSLPVAKACAVDLAFKKTALVKWTPEKEN